MYDYDQFDTLSYSNNGPLTLSNGFTDSSVTTFSEFKTLSGFGPEGTAVGIYVFHYETLFAYDDYTYEVMVPTLDRITHLGSSGLFSENIPLDHIGDNFVVIMVEDPETLQVTKKMFKVTREEHVTMILLENVRIDFFEEKTESPSLMEFNPQMVEF